MEELEGKFRTASTEQKAFARELLARVHAERKKVKERDKIIEEKKRDITHMNNSALAPSLLPS